MLQVGKLVSVRGDSRYNLDIFFLSAFEDRGQVAMLNVNDDEADSLDQVSCFGRLRAVSPEH